MRVAGATDDHVLTELFELLKVKYPREWLLCLEILEITNNIGLANAIDFHLKKLTAQHPEFTSLISDGIQIIKQEVRAN